MSSEEFGVYKYVLYEKLTLGNLVSKLTFDDGVNQNRLCNHNISKEQVNKYVHKGFLLLSLMIQCFLKHMALPMKKLSFKLEHFFNGNEIQDLDRDINHEDGRYHVMLSMMASKIAYENEAIIQNVVSQQWKMEFIKFYNFYNEFQQKYSTQAFIFQDRNPTNNNNMIYVCFRGTSVFNADDLSTNFDISWCKIKGLGKRHMGFTLALGVKKYHPDNNTNTNNNSSLKDYCGYWPKKIDQDEKYPLAYYTIREKLKELLANNPRSKIIVTGHSLGGALAILFPAILTLHKEWELLDTIEGVYTYGQPRVGDENFGQIMSRKFKEHGVKHYRIVYANDIVPNVPWDHLMMFKHFGMCIHFNSLYHAKLMLSLSSLNYMQIFSLYILVLRLRYVIY